MRASVKDDWKTTFWSQVAWPTWSYNTVCGICLCEFITSSLSANKKLDVEAFICLQNINFMHPSVEVIWCDSL